MYKLISNLFWEKVDEKAKKLQLENDQKAKLELENEKKVADVLALVEHLKVKRRAYDSD